ncbi:imidazole glycerol phosphate synthase subunit HisH [Aminivibrio sp.]|jgi:glutamine amidotransferase|uniref:imidazole glycerol phosphate synthase subunit HisH n=1 Tax=Aminivibrio sp. TaxID=1872489 RepID=UPI001A421D32|nr:imidazole glycerol phosphate synthase subunit HisH [Aminivibrio sp.]MBL3540513.1 imidazole glycerol phosphate synthase subunit HisH [Aminivibrio sp.]MDK2958774.1 imidazole glycerol-phosphate synthase subunit HisH [Synergistaceae bacterium]
MIAIVDYQVGNTGNVRRAFNSLGEEALLLSSPAELTPEFSLAVLPGVGAFGPASARLRASGWADRLIAWAAEGNPLLGICLGMQLLCERGLEDGDHPGLGLIPGEIRLLEAEKIPHMGWNSVEWTGKPPEFTPAVPSGEYFYFVHSYALFDPAFAAGQTSVGGTVFTSMVLRGRIAGFQFHPERSGRVGLDHLSLVSAHIRKKVP